MLRKFAAVMGSLVLTLIPSAAHTATNQPTSSAVTQTAQAAVDTAEAALIPHRPPGIYVNTTASGWAHTLPGIARTICHHTSPAVTDHIARDNKLATKRVALPAGMQILVTRAACNEPNYPIPQRPRYAAPAPTPTATGVERVIAYAMAQRGDPYRWGAVGPYAFDCSGLVIASFLRVGVRLPHWSGGRAGVVSSASLLGHGIRVSRSQLRRGDVVWPFPGHVMIYLGGGMVIHSPHPGAYVKVAKLGSFWTARRYV